jgi:hypothetical protein
MSLINSDGKNTNWQFNVLKGLESVKNALSVVKVVPEKVARRATVTRITNSSTLPANIGFLTIKNTGLADGSVNSVVLKSTESVTFNAEYLNAIAVNATGTEFLVSYVL